MNFSNIKLLIGPKSTHSFKSESKELIGVVVTACVMADIPYHIFKKKDGWEVEYVVTDALDDEFKKMVKRYNKIVAQIK